MLFKAAIVLVFCCLGLTHSQVPIPTRPEGYGVGPYDASVIVEMYLDLLCPGCQAAWPTMLQLIQFYGSRIQFVIHTFPLPYHTNSFIVNQGLHVISNLTMRNIDTIYRYSTSIFRDQAMWYNSATMDMTINQVTDSLASYVEKNGFATKSAFLKGLMSDDINDETRISWKYACSRAVVGTPTFMINGVAIAADDSWSLDDWKSVINGLLPPTTSTAPPTTRQQPGVNDDCPSGQFKCEYLPRKTQCCLTGERCIPNVGCRCFNLRGSVCV